MQQTPHQRKTLTERVIHAITFEGLATLILAPTAAWLMQRSVVEMGGLSILLATLAMVWNIIYNAAFDRLWPVSRFPRQLKVRALHALGFETGFVIIGVTMVAIVLGVSLLQAFMLEIGEIRANIRSCDVFNSAAFAENFGGGGHVRAAGFTLHNVDLNVLAEEVIGKATELL